MPAQRIIRILTRHDIATRVFGDRLQAAESYSVERGGRVRAGRRWVDVTGWSTAKIAGWLGY